MQCGSRAAYLGAVGGSPILAVAMLLEVKVGQAADVADPLHKHCVVTHKLQDGISAVGQGEVQHKGREQNAGHLLNELTGLRSKLEAIL